MNKLQPKTDGKSVSITTNKPLQPYEDQETTPYHPVGQHRFAAKKRRKIGSCHREGRQDLQSYKYKETTQCYLMEG